MASSPATASRSTPPESWRGSSSLSGSPCSAGGPQRCAGAPPSALRQVEASRPAVRSRRAAAWPGQESGWSACALEPRRYKRQHRMRWGSESGDLDRCARYDHPGGPGRWKPGKIYLIYWNIRQENWIRSGQHEMWGHGVNMRVGGLYVSIRGTQRWKSVICALVCTAKSVLIFLVRSFDFTSNTIHHLAKLLTGPKTTHMCSEDRDQALANVQPASVSVHVQLHHLPRIRSDPPTGRSREEETQALTRSQCRDLSSRGISMKIHPQRRRCVRTQTNFPPPRFPKCYYSICGGPGMKAKYCAASKPSIRIPIGHRTREDTQCVCERFFPF